jgi:hypothetical protein
MAMDTLADPNTFATTVGIVEKKPPLDTPFKMTKTIMGARVVETGQSASMLTPVRRSENSSTLSAPRRSHRIPQRILPTADEKLKLATNIAPVLELRSIDLEYNGTKNGGTKSGKVPMAPARKMIIKVSDLNSLLS